MKSSALIKKLIFVLKTFMDWDRDVERDNSLAVFESQGFKYANKIRP